MAFADDYIDVATRLRMFKDKYPDGSLQPVNLDRPIEAITIEDKTFLAYTAAAYRTPDDTRPGIGVAWEPFPGQTNYTRNSEAMNAETSAWGRAIVAALAADMKKGVASREDIENRHAEREQAEQVRQTVITKATGAIDAAATVEALDDVAQRITRSEKQGLITGDDAIALRQKLVLKHGDVTGLAKQEELE